MLAMPVVELRRKSGIRRDWHLANAHVGDTCHWLPEKCSVLRSVVFARYARAKATRPTTSDIKYTLPMCAIISLTPAGAPVWPQ
jgi:hypothetical protein